MHLAGVVVELHLQVIGLDARGLSRRSPRVAAAAQPRRQRATPDEPRAEHAERNGEDLDPTQHQEPGRKQRHRPSADAQSARDVGGVRLREGAHDKERKGERGQSENEITHQAPAAPLLSCASSRRAPAAFALTAERQQRLATARGVDGDGGEQIAQLTCRARVEAAEGALGQPRDLAKRPRRRLVAALLEHEHGDAEEAEFAGARAQPVDILLHAVADVDEGVDLAPPAFIEGVAEHLADLRETALAADAAHEAGERIGIGHPFRGAAFAHAAEIDELHVETAHLLHCREHLALQLQRHVPRRRAAHRGIHGEDETAALAGGGGCQRLHLGDERGNVGIGRRFACRHAAGGRRSRRSGSGGARGSGRCGFGWFARGHPRAQ